VPIPTAHNDIFKTKNKCLLGKNQGILCWFLKHRQNPGDVGGEHDIFNGRVVSKEGMNGCP
jgi:hypothetical protein